MGPRATKGGLGRPQGGRKCGEVMLRVLGFPGFLGVAKNHPKIVPETPEVIFPSSTGPNEQLFCLAQQLWSKPLAPRIFGKVAPLMLLIPLDQLFLATRVDTRTKPQCKMGIGVPPSVNVFALRGESPGAAAPNSAGASPQTPLFAPAFFGLFLPYRAPPLVGL
jgi:hypothetical protein